MKSRGHVLSLVLFFWGGQFAVVLAQPTSSAAAAISSASQTLAKQATITKLERIHLPEIKFENSTLSEVLRQMNDLAKQYDPEKTGVVLLATTNSATNSIEEINSVVIKMPRLTDVRLIDVLDAIDIVAEKPIQHTITSDGKVVFSMKPAPQLYARAFKVNTNAFIAVLNQITDVSLPTNLPATYSYSSAGRIHLQTNSPPSILSAKAKILFGQIGVDLKCPPGKFIFYNDRLGRIIVKATSSDLELIEKAISQLQLNQPSTNQ